MRKNQNIKDLNEKARKFATYSPEDISNIGAEEIQCLMYELQCHQIELEMQNDELIKTQLELTDLNNRLHLTYHQVPVGLLTLNSKGFINEANLNFAKMLRIDLNKVINAPFSRFIVNEDLYRYIRDFNDYFEFPENKSLQLQLYSEKSGPFPVLIKATPDDGSDVMTGSINIEQRKLVVVITDISDVINGLKNDAVT